MKITDLIKNKDKLLLILALAVLAGALLRFGTTKNVIHAKIPRIVFTQWWEDYLEKDTLQKLINEFEETHKGIEVVLSSVSYEDLEKGLFGSGGTKNEQMLSGDLIALDMLWVPELLKNETIEGEWAENPLQNCFDAPLLSFINVLYYNIDSLREAGFSRPPKDRSEFIIYARALTDKEKDHWGLAMGLNSSQGIYNDIFPWIWSAGASLIKDGKPELSSRPVIESLSFLSTLKNEGLITPNALFTGDENKLEDFISRKAAFMIAPASDIEYVRKRMGDEAFGITSVPIPDNYTGKIYNATLGWTLGINKTSVYKKEAELLANFLAVKLSERAVSMQVNSSRDPFFSKVWDITITGENAQDFKGLPWNELAEVFREEFSFLYAE